MAEVLRLFLIEDNDDVALLIRKSLERMEHQVTRCRTAADALIVLANSTFDLVILDNCLPDMAGLDLMQRLTREGLLRVDSLLPRFFEPEHRGIRYT